VDCKDGDEDRDRKIFVWMGMAVKFLGCGGDGEKSMGTTTSWELGNDGGTINFMVSLSTT